MRDVHGAWAVSEMAERAFGYLWNADPKRGRVRIASFDEDHEPIGPALRRDLVALGWVYEERDFLVADRPPREYWSEPGEAP